MPTPELPEVWRRVYKGTPPRLPPDLLRLGIAYELQRRKHGGLSRATLAELRRRAAPAERKAPALPALRPGTCLVRTWHGKTHSVAVGQNDFTYEGRSYASLTAIAEEITGTRWSGPRFFGVRGR